MLRTVHFGKRRAQSTAFELFPDPALIFQDWNEELAARLLPVACFDVSMAGGKGSGPGVFLYYDDPAPDFLEWEVRDGRIVNLRNWRELRPFTDPPDVAALERKYGGYLEYEAVEIEIGPPSEYDDPNWNHVFADRLDDAGVPDAFDRPRVGGGYPVYVQGCVDLDDPGFVAELPAAGLGLAPMYFYLFEFDGAFQQMMEMT